MVQGPWLPASVGLSGDPFAEQRVHNDVLLSLLEQQILLHQSGQRRLDAGGASQPVTRAHVRRQQLPPALQNYRTKDRALRQGQPLPDRFEYRRYNPGSCLEIVERQSPRVDGHADNGVDAFGVEVVDFLTRGNAAGRGDAPPSGPSDGENHVHIRAAH